MNRYTELHATEDLVVRRFDHPPHERHDDPDREVAEGWSIAFVRDGSFDIAVQGRSHRLGPGSVLLTRPGLAFRCSHEAACPDDVCLSVGFDAGVVAGHEHLWLDAGWSARPRPTPRLAHAQHRLAQAAGASDAFETERWALAALSALALDAREATRRGHYAARRGELDAVMAACRAVEVDPGARRSVADRAREVGMNGARLTLLFRRYVGASPHEYVLRWRLVTAGTLLKAGATVSESCYRSGFENLSHFCRTFQRAFGVRASAWRALPARETRRKVQDLLRGRP